MKSKSLSPRLLLIALTFAFAIVPSTASAGANSAVSSNTVDGMSASLRSPILARVALSAAQEPSRLAQIGDDPVDVYGFKRKSPTRAFLQSFLIPGWGQFYAKSAIWKPILAVGMEAGSWLGYTSFHGNGNDLETEYKAFADLHWDSTDYIDGLYTTFYSRDKPESVKDAWLDTTTYIVNEFIDGELVSVPRSLSHQAWYKGDGSAVERDEYYENVGKYNQFNFGWDDYRDGLDSLPYSPADTARLNYVSPNRNTYLNMRDNANQEFNKANTMLVAAVANHLLWGFWAALDARAFNRAQDQFSRIETNLQLVKSPSDPRKYMPYFTMRYRF